MALNTSPIYSGVGQIESTATYGTTFMTAANANLDGSGTTSYTAFSSSISGSFVQRIRFKASGSTTQATVARIYINNGGGTGSAGNNFLFDDITLPATTTSATAGSTTFEIPLNIALPPSYRILITLGTAQTNAGWIATTVAGSYVTT